MPWQQELEPICIHPSTELIPDEYQCKKIHANVFFSSDNCDLAETILETLGLPGQKQNLSNVEDVRSKIKEIQNLSDIDGLLLIFLGHSKRDGTVLLDDQSSLELCHIWSEFTASRCEALKNKPKIFLFYLKKPRKSIAKDHQENGSDKFDAPVESDILVMYQCSEDPYPSFKKTCENIEQMRKFYQIVDLLSIEVIDSPPIIISTLTRKFYLVASEERGYINRIYERDEYLKRRLSETIDRLSQIKPKSRKPSALDRLGSFLRKKSDENRGLEEGYLRSPTLDEGPSSDVWYGSRGPRSAPNTKVDAATQTQPLSKHKSSQIASGDLNILNRSSLSRGSSTVSLTARPPWKN